MDFLYPYLLILIPFLVPLWILSRRSEDEMRRHFKPELYEKMVAKGGGLSRSSRKALIFVAIAFGILALSRPGIGKGEIKVKQSTIDLIVAFDISRSMFSNDVYPNRLELSKRKFYDFLNEMKEARIGVIGFSSRAFLVAPPTRDYASLKYLVEHMGFDYVTLKGTDMMAPLEVTQNLLKTKKEKGLLIFTDGGDRKDFSREIAFAKKHGIKVFVYAVATKKGGIMKFDKGIVRDSRGNVVITRLNPSIRELAEKTGGIYMPFSLRSSDMKMLAASIRNRLKSNESKERTIQERDELFYYPLLVAIVLFLMANSSLPKRFAGERFRSIRKEPR